MKEKMFFPVMAKMQVVWTRYIALSLTLPIESLTPPQLLLNWSKDVSSAASATMLKLEIKNM